MQLSEIVRSEAVRPFSVLTSKKRLFQHLGEIAAEAYGLEEAEVVAALHERESLGPTAVGGGVALPHARVTGLDRVAGMMIRLDEPIEFGAADRQPVDLIFGLLAPHGAGLDHLRALASVARTLRDGNVCHKLRANTDPVKLHAILTEARASQAA